MSKILIKQNGKKCELWADGVLIKTAGRVEIKKEADIQHKKTGMAVYNIKKGGSEFLVTASVSADEDAKELKRLRAFYTRSGAMILIDKYWPDIYLEIVSYRSLSRTTRIK